MLRQELAQRDRCALVEKYPHLGRGQGAPGRMLEHGADLLMGNAREPIQKLRDLGAVFEVLKKGRNRHARAAEHPGSTHTFGITLHGRAGRPVNHALHPTTGTGRRLNPVKSGRCALV